MSAHLGSVQDHRRHAGGQCQAATTWRSTIRCIVTLTFALLSVPLTSEAQLPKTIPRIAYLALSPGPQSSVRSEALAQGLRELGYVEGKNILMEYWWSAGNVDRLRENAAELVRLGVHVIVTQGPVATRAAKDMTRTIPIVMAGDVDPVGDGFVASLGRPGGNITGVTVLTRELSGKRLELLKDTAPGMVRVAVFWNPTEVSGARQLRDTEDAARVLGLQVQALEVRGLDDFAGAFAAARTGRADGLILLAGPGPGEHGARLVDLAAQSRLPTIYYGRGFAEAGGLMSYGANDHDMARRAAYYVDRILKGVTPADLPVEQPTKFELVINLKAAQALGITIPPHLLVLADEVIK
jgi:putative tryptophan/tyrosine transport system substrate-binding protein